MSLPPPTLRTLQRFLAAVLLLGLTACSQGSGPTAGGDDARIVGVLTSDASGGQAALAGGPSDGSPTGGVPLVGATVRLVDGSGNVLFDSTTDAEGGFELRAPPGTYSLEIALADGNAFTIDVTVDDGEQLFLQARVRGAGGPAVIDVELFTDDDGDGVSDSGFTIRIIGRQAGRPGSGEEIIERDPGRDLDDEEDDLERGAPAELGDLREGQRVLAKGHGLPRGFEANEVHGNAGEADRFCRLSGFLTGVVHGPDGGIRAIEIFGATVTIGNAHVTGVRGGTGLESALEAGVRAEIHAIYQGTPGELEALRIHARGGSGRDPERIAGLLTAPPDVDARLLEICGIRVEVTRDAKITNGFGGDDDDNDDDDDDDDDDDGEVTFAEFLAALGTGAFNHDARGDFALDAGVLSADHLTLSRQDRRPIELTGEVHDLNPGAGTFRLLGLPVVIDDGTEFKGNLRGVAELVNGLHVEVEAHVEGGTLVADEIRRAGDRRDRVRGGQLLPVAGELDAPLNFEIQLGEGLRVPVDAGPRTKFEIETD